MDLVGYAALGGLERVAIVAGAVIIGYWGYRLYTAEKNAGLVFMALSVLVLAGALITGASHMKSIGEGYQLASANADAGVEDDFPAERAVTAASEGDIGSTAGGEETDSPFRDPAPAPETVPGDASKTAEDEPPAVAELLVEAAPAQVTEPALAAEVATPVRLATGQELGGRIVSVKSENVSLEWSTDSD